MVDDYSQDPEVRAWLKRVKTELVPLIESSQITVSICPDVGSIDPKFCVELGVSIMLDKPIVVAVPAGRKIPPLLARIASRIVEWADDPQVMQARLMEAVESIDRSGRGA